MQTAVGAHAATFRAGGRMDQDAIADKHHCSCVTMRANFVVLQSVFEWDNLGLIASRT
jgi:hypothetical protein